MEARMRAVDVEADVVRPGEERLPGAQADAHPDRYALRPRVRPDCPLRRHGRRHRGLRISERDQKRVALRVDLTAAMGLKRRAEQALLGMQDLGVALIAQMLEQHGRTFDVREEERHGATRQANRGRAFACSHSNYEF